MPLKKYRPFKWATVHLSRSKECKHACRQNLRFEKKFCCLANSQDGAGDPDSSPRQWDDLQSLMDHNFAALKPTETHNNSMERSKPL